MSDCLIEISRVADRNYKTMYELAYKGRYIATNLTLEEAVDLAKEMQENESKN